MTAHVTNAVAGLPINSNHYIVNLVVRERRYLPMNRNRSGIVAGLIIVLLCIVVALELTLLVMRLQREEGSVVTTHPLTGTWIVRMDGNEAPGLINFSSSGTAQQTSDTGDVGLGVWSPTGLNSATSTIFFQDLRGEDMSRGWKIIRGDNTVHDDGMTFTGVYTVQFRARGNGASSGEIGPGSVEGQRISPEPVGTPVLPLDMLETHPNATPISLVLP